MAKILKIDLNLGNLANPSKTTRKSSTNPLSRNPFEYRDFEGNVLPVEAFADVFEGSNAKTNKLKMIASSVAGSITKLRSGVTESVVNFVNRVKEGIVGAWDYAKNTTIEIPGMKTFGENFHNVMNYDVTKGITDTIQNIGNDITGLRKGISDKWTDLISKIHHEKISSTTPVAELRAMWEKENERILEEGKKVA